MFNADHGILSPVVLQLPRKIDIFQLPHPVVNNPPDFAIVQQKTKAIIFLKSPPFHFSDEFRLVFWYMRNPKPINGKKKEADIPEEETELLIARSVRQLLMSRGLPVPQNIEDTIKEEEQKLFGTSIILDHYLKDTFSISLKDFPRLNNPQPRPPKATAQEIDQLKIQKWMATKSEFCHKVITEYRTNMASYQSYKDATHKLFAQHTFPYKWNAKKCYELVKKILQGNSGGI